MKTSKIETLISRVQTAKRVTNKLAEQSQQFCNFVEEQMEDLGVNSLMNGKYELRTIRSSCGSDTSLYLKISGGYYSDDVWVTLDSQSISAERELRYLHGDYHCSYRAPSREDVLTFLGDAEAILEDLADMDKDLDLTLVQRVIAERNQD